MSVGIKPCPCWICYKCVQFQIEIRKICRYGSRSPDNAEFVHFSFFRGRQGNVPRIITHVCSRYKYLLITEFEGRTVSYGPVFSCAKRAGHKSKGKKQGSVTYSMDRENNVSKIFIISLVCVLGAQERFLFTRKGFKFLTLESKTSQFEIVFKSLARFNT